MEQLIALYAPPALARAAVPYFEHAAYARIAFGDPARAMAEALVRQTGAYLTGQVTEIMSSSNDGLPVIGTPASQLLREIEEFGRDRIRRDIWLQLAKHKIQGCLNGKRKVLVEDLQTEEQYLMLREMEASFWRLQPESNQTIVSTPFTTGRSKGELDHFHFDVDLSAPQNLGKLRDLIYHQFNNFKGQMALAGTACA